MALQVHGGVDLRLSTKSHPSHRRVPSDEAILRMAAQQRVRNLDPRLLVGSGSSPLPEVAKLPAKPDPVQQPLADHLQKLVESSDSEDESDAKDIKEKQSQESAAHKKQSEASAVFGER